MNRRVICDPEVYVIPHAYFEPNDIPPTLKALITLIFADYGSEILATADLYHQWLGGEERRAGAIISHDGQKGNHQTLGEITHSQQGVEIARASFLDCLTHHQCIVKEIDSMNATEQKRCQTLMVETGGKEVTDLRLQRAMVRNNFSCVVSDHEHY